jgi:type I restriction enzyme S subunit
MNSSDELEVPLGSVANISTGGTPSTDVPDYWDGAVPWITTGDIDFNVITRARQFLTEEGMRNSAAKLLPAGTLLMAMYGQGATRGKVARLGIEAATNQACAAIQPRHEEFSTDFLYVVLEASYESIRSRANIGGQANLSTALIRETPVPRVSSSTREKALGTHRQFERALGLLHAVAAQINVRNAAARRAIFRGLADDRFLELGEVTSRVLRRNTVGCDRTLSISGRRGLVLQDEYFNRSITPESGGGQVLLLRGEFAFNRSASDGYPYGATKRLDDYAQGVVSSIYTCFALAQDSPVGSDYLVQLLESGFLDPQLRRMNNIGSRAHGLLNITAEDYFRLRLPVPGALQQASIVRALKAQDTELALVAQLTEQLSMQKRALISRLLWDQPRRSVAVTQVGAS